MTTKKPTTKKPTVKRAPQSEPVRTITSSEFMDRLKRDHLESTDRRTELRNRRDAILARAQEEADALDADIADVDIQIDALDRALTAPDEVLKKPIPSFLTKRDNALKMVGANNMG